ncbi:hypothetical protein CH282_01685 [Rhodococcus sp. 06-418-1B]|nr:SIR2 family protein [Rhodococcus sp. 06-418-1B]OZC93000.1 hypothetical protein CH282_01685 [Rhodococcus sp. 06-418-1B]
MPSTPTADNDSLLTLAFSLHSNPGAYAMLLGAGISASAQVPTAWGVLTDLIVKSAAAAGEQITTDDAEQWYRDRNEGEAPRYETLLETLAPTQLERQRLLSKYFEGSPTPQNEDLDTPNGPAPSIAHKSIARLVKRGIVKVLVTMNFDRLMEAAIRDEGIEPTVVASEADVVGLAPLHTIGCCVIHLHGDYLNPETMLNTAAELGSYRPRMLRLLERVLAEYGLVIAGWSATYDPALRSAISEHYSPRLTMTWVEPFEQSEVAADLVALKKARVLKMNADTAFGTILDSIESIATAQSRHPETVAVTAATAKRSLSGRWTAIDLHDTFGAELDRLHSHPNFNLATYDGHAAQYNDRVRQVWDASRIPAALVAVMACWGNATTDSWWLDEVDRFATRPRVSGLTAMIKLRTVAGSFLFYAAGVTAVAAKRYDLLAKLLHKSVVEAWTQNRIPLTDALDPSAVYEGRDRPDHDHYIEVYGVLSEVLGMPAAGLDDAWQQFEVIPHAARLAGHDTFASKAEAYRSEYQKYVELLSRRQSGQQTVSQQDIHEAFIAKDRIVGEVATIVPMSRPHIFANEVERSGRTAWGSPVADRIAFDLVDEGDAHPLVTAHVVDLNSGALALAVKAVGVQVTRIAQNLENGSFVRGRTRGAPDELWIDVGIEY